jgi:hypothetical protein
LLKREKISEWAWKVKNMARYYGINCMRNKTGFRFCRFCSYREESRPEPSGTLCLGRLSVLENSKHSISFITEMTIYEDL